MLVTRAATPMPLRALPIVKVSPPWSRWTENATRLSAYPPASTSIPAPTTSPLRRRRFTGPTVSGDNMSMTVSYAHGASEKPLLGEPIGANLGRTAADHPDADALVSCEQGVRLTYAEVDERVDRAAAALIAAGLEPGDRLGIWSPNRAEWTLIQYATARAGVILVNVNPAYRTSELEYALRQSGCRMLIAAQSFKTSDYREMGDEVAPKCEALERVVFFDPPEWDALLAGGDAERELPELSFDDPINIQYTSGTTGFP